jgi:hypothetical protein
MLISHEKNEKNEDPTSEAWHKEKRMLFWVRSIETVVATVGGRSRL